ncbi:MAG: hypothetical protein FWE67_09650 [Planctomycetaceae bacterium]|nr:hypothetical protein [Planctomycetaceae bacterium]
MKKFFTIKRPAVYVLIVWLAFLGMHGYYLLLDVWNTPHPTYLPLFSFIGVQGFALFLAVIAGAWHFVRGPQRLQTAMWIILGFLPVFLWYSLVSLSFHALEERRSHQVEASWCSLTTQSIAAALFDGACRWTLPHRLEGDRVVMFHDSMINDPQSDLKKMDEYIKKEEEYLGTTTPVKIHWMRAELLGLTGLALSHIALAPSEKMGIGSIDYHEAAHNIIGTPTASMVYTGRYPPAFLVEGWAMARSEKWESLARECWLLKQSHQALTLREAVSDVYYNQMDYRLYQQGGAFVKVLCDKFGPKKFLELYRNCTRKTFVQDIERIYGMPLEELDALYWQEIESYRASQRSFDKAIENCSPEEKALLDEFRKAYEKQMQDFYRLTQNCTLETVLSSSVRSPDYESDGREELLFQARDGQWARAHKKFEGTRKELSKENGVKTERNTERIDCGLMTPNERITTFQYSSSEKNSTQQNTWRNEILSQHQEFEQQRFRRFHLKTFHPFSLFFTGYGHSFSVPDEYMWEPPIGTIIQSVVAEGDTIVLTLTTADAREQTLTLRMDRSRNYLLLNAESRETYKEKTFESFDVREYGNSIDGVPQLKKRTVSRVGLDSRNTATTEVVRFDPAPVNEDVFRVENLPLNVSKTKERISVEQRMRRHGTIAGCWLGVPILVIFLMRCSRTSPQKIDEKKA